MRLLLALLILPGLAAAAAAEGDAAKGETVFKKCRICHDVGEGAKIKVGPPLTAIVGARAAGNPDFNYSAKLKQLGAEGFVWTEAMLSDYLTDPRQLVPGGKMAFPGLKKDEDRQDVIAYLKSLSN